MSSIKESINGLFAKVSKKQLFAAVVCVVLAVAVLVYLSAQDDTGNDLSATNSSVARDDSVTEQTSSSVQMHEQTEAATVPDNPQSENPLETVPAEETDQTEDDPDETEQEYSGQEDSEQTQPTQEHNDPTQPQPTQPQEDFDPTEPIVTLPDIEKPEVEFTEPTDPEPTVTLIELPYTIEGTDLKILRVAPYDGMYMEDGSNENVSGIAMMLLENTGEDALEYANITLEYEDQTIEFQVSALDAGAKVIVQAKDRASCAEGDLVNCSAQVAVIDGLDMAEESVSVTDNGDGSLTIKNLTDEEIVAVRVFYKYYMEDEDIYVGGITFTAKITDLGAGESITVTPAHFSSGSGKVVMVRIYDTDE